MASNEYHILLCVCVCSMQLVHCTTKQIWPVDVANSAM